MLHKNDLRSKSRPLTDWFHGKPVEIRSLFDHFVREYQQIGNVTIRPAKSMIVVTTPRKGVAYIVPRKNHIDVVLPFKKAYPNNFCFHKIAQVPIGPPQFNHHLRLVTEEDVNKEVKGFMRLAFEEGS